MRWIPFLLASLFATTGCVSIDEKGKGVRDAQKRLKKGELVYAMESATYSFSDETPTYWQILREEHGLSHEIMLGESDEYVDGFKSVMKPEIEKRFDSEFFDRVMERAKLEYKADKR
jgi:hypothetical protein